MAEGLTRTKAAIKALGVGYATAVKDLDDDGSLVHSLSYDGTFTGVQVCNALGHSVLWADVTDDDLAPFVTADGACIVPANDVKLTVNASVFDDMSTQLAGPFGSCVFRLSHLTIDGINTTPRLSPLDTCEASWTMVVALDSPHPRDVIITHEMRSELLELLPDRWRDDCAAWYVDCNVKLAPISVGRCAYLVYVVQHVDAPTQRTAPPYWEDTVSVLSSLAAVPRQLATTYAYRCAPNTDLCVDKYAFKPDIIDSLVTAGTFDVALVWLTDATREEPTEEALEDVRDAIYRLIPNINDVLDDDEQDELDDELAFDIANQCAGQAAAYLYKVKPRDVLPKTPNPDGYDPTHLDNVIKGCDAAAVDAGYVDEDEQYEHKDFGVYARDNSYVDLDLQPVPDFVTNFGTTFEPILPPPRTIIDVEMHPQTPLPNDLATSLLVGRTVGKWVATKSLMYLSSRVLLFWPKKHRVRLFGFAAAFQLLQDAFHAPHKALPLGYATLSELATAVMEMLGDTDVPTTDADRKAMTAFVSESRSALLRSLYVTHCIDVFDDAKRCDGVVWLKTTCVEFGWEDVGAAIVQLVDQSLGDWHKNHAYAYLDWAGLAATLRLVMALLDALAEYKQPYFSELIVMLWHTVVANVVRFRDEKEDCERSSIGQRTCALRAMLQLEARAASEASTTSSWFGSRLPSTLVAAIRSFVAPVGSVVSIVQRYPVAMAPLLELLPGILDMDAASPTPLLPLVQDALEAQYVDVARDEYKWVRNQRLARLHQWLGLERDLVATVSASWRLRCDTTACALLRALDQGLHVAVADATAIANALVGLTKSLLDRPHSYNDSDGNNAMLVVLLVLDHLSPSHVPRFVAGLLKKVGQADQYPRLQYTLSVLYPMIRLLDDKLPRLRIEACIAYLRDTTKKRAVATSMPSTKRAKHHASQR
ncbi:hypothetical protein SPRG_00084 [Saprolegnia parasitica CBS 223.65]|uniref:Uncharacterized protein n=1 Tax=Saprolegnia parasitica (strain CBS 223.65) TaxID=695850 RepID=A0A067CX34_SAPPC|nr:hypothetical protein SPRG_00084 [Saprolegnia parasitica CBS 223.65]KDO35239.1 hypothetical protein SPRG_00084 [Saprolegnia parasitica CBS 223.65]|eukprot:XP_012193590.1 hypothetical protein SPRG_00084 [Saprolegnia parasitica CBS 223.65]